MVINLNEIVSIIIIAVPGTHMGRTIETAGSLDQSNSTR